MSQEGYAKFRSELRPDGILMTERELVVVDEPPGRKAFSIPATRMAEQIGLKMSANIVMVGFFGAVTGIAGIDVLKKAIPGTVPDRFLDQNLKALVIGWEFGLKEVAAAKPAKEAVR